MTYEVRIQKRVADDLEDIRRAIQADRSETAQVWFGGLFEAIYSLGQFPARCPATPEDPDLGHLLYGRKPDVYRIIYEVDKTLSTVTVLHIRHGSRTTFDEKP